MVSRSEMELKLKPLWQDRLFWAAMAAGGFVLFLTLWFGIGVDSAVMSYCSWVWKHHGLPPYVGCKEGDFPGIFIIHRLSLLCGEDVLGFRIFDVLVQMAVLVMIFYLARRLSGLSLAGLLAVLFYSTYYYGLWFPMVGEREGFVLAMMLAAVVGRLVLGGWKLAGSLLTGLLAGFAFLTKPTFGLLWPVFGAWILWDRFRQRPGRVLRELAVFAGGCLLPGLLAVLYYWQRGALFSLYEMLYVFPVQVYLKMPSTTEGPLQALPLLLDRILHEGFAALAGALIGLVLLWFYGGRKERRLYWVIIVLCAVGFISADLQYRNGLWEYHRTPFWGLCFILAGGGWAWVLKLIRGERGKLFRRLLQMGLAAALLVLMFLRIPSDVRYFALHHSFGSLQKAYLAQYPLPEMAAEQLKAKLRPGDQVYYLGNISMLPFLLQHKLAAPFPYPLFLYMPRADGSFAPLQERWRDEYADGFLKIRPRFFIFDTYCQDCEGQSLASILKFRFPEIQAVLEREYHLAHKLYGIEVYERN